MLAALLIAAAVSAKPCPALTRNVTDTKFARGQVWSYSTRPGEPNSTLTIVEIDSFEKVGLIIHVHVDGLRMHNPRGDLVPSIGHMPFTRDAMLMSVNKLVLIQPDPKLPEGYRVWEDDCGGVYTVSVADAVGVAEKTLNQP